MASKSILNVRTKSAGATGESEVKTTANFSMEYLMGLSAPLTTAFSTSTNRASASGGSIVMRVVPISTGSVAVPTATGKPVTGSTYLDQVDVAISTFVLMRKLMPTSFWSHCLVTVRRCLTTSLNGT